MLLIEVTDVRSGNKVQVTKSQHMNKFEWGRVMHVSWPIFSFPTQWCWLDDHQRRLRLLSGEGQVNMLGSGQVKKVKF